MRRPPAARLTANHGESAVVYDGPGDVGGTLRRVCCRLFTDGVRRIDVDSGDSFLVSPDGDVVLSRSSDSPNGWVGRVVRLRAR